MTSADDERRSRRRLVVRVALAYAATMVVLVLLDVSPSPVLVAAFFLVVTVALVVTGERLTDAGGEPWAVGPPITTGLGRGADHRTTALARRLESRADGDHQRLTLATDIHRQLRAVLLDRVRRERGWDLAAHPGLARDALPADLADLVTGPPDPRLADATHLSAVLDRIEHT